MADLEIEFFDAGFEALALGPEIRAVLAAEAGLGKAHAEVIAPRRTGEYAGAFDVTEESVTVGRHERAAARLTNTSGYAAAVEYGNRGRKAAPGKTAQRVLGRTLEHLAEAHT
jgi:hypothetical protein